jgi:hypothetical protein
MCPLHYCKCMVVTDWKTLLLTLTWQFPQLAEQTLGHGCSQGSILLHFLRQIYVSGSTQHNVRAVCSQ